MTDVRPFQLRIEERRLVLECGTDVQTIRRVQLASVIDLNDKGELVGVEILGFAAHCGAHAARSIHKLRDPSGIARVAYHDDADGFSLRWSSDLAPEQRVVECLVSLNEAGEFVRLDVFMDLEVVD